MHGVSVCQITLCAYGLVGRSCTIGHPWDETDLLTDTPDVVRSCVEPSDEKNS